MVKELQKEKEESVKIFFAQILLLQKVKLSFQNGLFTPNLRKGLDMIMIPSIQKH